MDVRSRLQTALGSSYVLERELTGGGMSRVFVAHDTSLRRRVVVKMLPPELIAGVNVERFKREILVVAQLQHPHKPRITEVAPPRAATGANREVAPRWVATTAGGDYSCRA